MDEIKRLLDCTTALPGDDTRVTVMVRPGLVSTTTLSTLRRLVAIEEAATALVTADRAPLDLNDPYHASYWDAWEKLCEGVDRG